MKRDGALESLWQSEVEMYGDGSAGQKTDYDIVITGAGITGVSTAFSLQNKGFECLIVEASNIGFGTTGGTTAHLNNFFDASYDEMIRDFGLEKAKLLAHAAREALEIISQNITDYGIECDYSARTGYLFSLDEEQEKILDDLVEGSRQVGIGMNETDKNPFGIPCTKIVEIPDQAQFHPLKYIKGLLSEYMNSGGMIVEGCRVTGVEKKENHLVVSTTKGNIVCNHLVYATHLPPGKNIMHFRNAPYRSYVLALKLKNNNYPQALGYDLFEPYHYYRSHTIDGEEDLIAGGEDHKTGDIENTDECFEKLKDYVDQYFDIERVAYKWSSQFYEPADGLPYIGHLPGSPENVYCATGYSGNGMIFGTLAAKTLSDLITTGDSMYKDLFAPSRVKPVAGFSNVVKEGADVFKHLVFDKFMVERLQTLANLEKDEGKLINYEGSLVAVYKDRNGINHILESACTHLQCTVKWNREEKSWDCPCHGSRFGIDGEILTGPAVKKLKNVGTPEDSERLDLG
ncbi:FAD-dependent oxidoreductase [uncultured Proteiniphilum sp.]|uniref:FAD-dependent oxidoreductase n=1 Tax=uncultured Proteiniphilum sp. TaxID=497637 RepID=UPI002639E31E|nr:FAD-dependent oxidoreductase [uncultured Proteiniphilum sp.]